ncbi:MAG: putative DNA binding domain-containing protein [Thermomicrobiales bacterium]
MTLIMPGDIQKLLDSGDLAESVEFEAKRASNGFPGNAWATVSAFANTNGGIIVLGLEEGDGDWIIAGVQNPDRIIQDVHNLMRNPQKISREVASNDDIWKEQIDGKWLVIIRVNRAARRDRPVYLDREPAKAFIRRHEGDARCTESELARFSAEATVLPWDMGVIPYLNIGDLDQQTIERYRALSQERRPSLPHHNQAQPEFLRAIGAWRTDRETGQEGPTVAGILMFGTDIAIREVRPNHVIDYRRISSASTPTTRWIDRVRWTGNLFGAWDEIYPRLTRSLATPFRLRGPQRIDRLAGEDSLREAFVNLLVHADYREQRDAVILHRDNGYEFLNPGDSWVAIESLGVEASFDRRNPVIASLFNYVGLADQAGSGYIRILDEWRELGYRPPAVHSDAARYEFSLILGLSDMLSFQDRTWLTEIGGPWAASEELALVYARHTDSIDNATLRQATGQHLFDASQTLRSLRDRGLLVREGAGKNSYYVLGPAAHMRNGDALVSGDNVATSEDKGATSRDKDAIFGNKKPASGDKTDEGEQDAEWVNQEIVRITAPVSNRRRSSPATIMDAITELCRLIPMSTGDLSRLLEREQDTLRPYLRSLIADGKIEPTREPINHPSQRYRAVEAVSVHDVKQQVLDI